MKKKLVFVTGAGMSKESGLSTFRDFDGLWENYPVAKVATHEAWNEDPNFVNDFYNMLRTKYIDAKPCEGHKLIATLQDKYDVTVVTQNCDNLHEVGGAENVIHLHGEMMKMCSSRDVDNPRFHVKLPHDGYGPTGLEIPHDEKAGDGSLLRPYIVFFGENVPYMYDAAKAVEQADILVIIGTSLVVYPAASLINYVKSGTPIYLIDPADISTHQKVTHIKCGASEGMRKLIDILNA